MTDTVTEWQVFRYFLGKIAAILIFAFGSVTFLLLMAIATGNGYATGLMAFLDFVYLPILVLGLYQWRKKEMRVRLTDEPALNALKELYMKVVDEKLGPSVQPPAEVPKPTEGEVFRYYLKKIAVVPCLLFGIFIPAFAISAWNGNVLGMWILSFMAFIYTPAIIMGMYVATRDTLYAQVTAQPLIKRLQGKVLKALDESPLNPANREGPK